MLGLFSLIDAMLDRPLEAVLKEIPLARDVVQALCERKEPLALPYRCVLAWECGDWAELDRLATERPPCGDVLAEAHLAALEWLRESEEFLS
jgi:EAL and modified HD-GYP domain-containing signal transduction protein